MRSFIGATLIINRIRTLHHHIVLRYSLSPKPCYFSTILLELLPVRPFISLTHWAFQKGQRRPDYFIQQACVRIKSGSPHIRHEEVAEAPNMKRSAAGQVKVNQPLTNSHIVQEGRQLQLQKIHGSLMKMIVLPIENVDSCGDAGKSLHAFSTSSLMTMAMKITAVNKDSMKVVVALWSRFDRMSSEEILTVADIFFHNNMVVPWYTSAMLSFFDEMFGSLSFTPVQLTRIVFHINNHGSAPPALLDSIEQRILSQVAEFDVNLLAAICYLYFTGQNRIRSPILMDKIASSFLVNFTALEKTQLPMIMKMLRFSNYIKVSFYKDLGDRLVSSRYLSASHKLVNLMHIAYAYASVRVTHPQLFEAILKQCKNTHGSFRAKDVSKLIWACGTLVTTQGESLACIQNLLHHMLKTIQPGEIQKYPDNIVDLLMGLVMLNIYPKSLFNMLFDPTVLKVLFCLPPHREKFIQLMFLDNSISLECPDYSGFRLTQKDLDVICQQHTYKTLEMDMMLRKSVKPAVDALRQTLGHDKVLCQFLLPHCQTSDILVSFNTVEKSFVEPVPKPLKTISREASGSSSNIQDIVLLLLSRAQTSYDGKPLGLLHCKIRQLKTLGYHVVPIDAEEALCYTCQDVNTTQQLLLRHISKCVGSDITQSLQKK